jgi:transcriptional regulator with GAF, ATPase, and Fis domain/predicted negative regulator of RcsB-dependent stress response
MGAPLLGGRYKLLERLAAGGQGDVFLAEDTSSGDRIAVKCARDASEAARHELASEFARVASLQHRGIAGAVDFSPGQGDELPFVVFERARGRPSTKARDDAEPRAMLGWASGVAETLDFLHQAGLLHGDLKPQHVFVGPRDEPQLIDLGLARAPGTLGGGTPATAAPEVLDTGRGDERSDLYGLGATLFFWLYGRYPWSESLEGRLATLSRRPALPADDRLPSGVSDLLRELLAPSPEDRPQTARAVVARLAELGIGLPDPALAAPLARAASLPLLARDDALAALTPAWEGARGTPRFIALVGPPGSGRSRLLREADRRARLAGRRVLAFAPDSVGDTRRLRPLAALRSEADSRELTALLDEASGWPEPERGLIEALPSRLVEAEDLVVVGCFTERPGTSGWNVVALPRLGPESVRALAALLAPGPPWSAALAERLTDAADGWPGPVVDIVGNAVRHGVLRCGPAGWDPTPLEAADLEELAPRAEALADPGDAGEASLARALALSAEPAPLTQLARVAGLELPEAARAARRLVAQRLAYRDTSGRLRAGRQARRQPPPGDAGAFEQIHARWLSELRRAAPTGEPGRVAWLGALARHAAGCGRPRLAARLAARAVIAALHAGRPDLGSAALAGLRDREPGGDEARARLAASAGEVELSAARAREAVTLLQRAAEGFARAERPVEAELARIRLARALGDVGRSEEALERLRAVRTASPEPALRARVAVEEGIVLARSYRYDAALDAFQRAAGLAPSGSLLEARARANLGRCLILLGRLDDGVGQLQLARQPAAAAGDVGLEAALRLAEAQAALARRDPRRVLDQVRHLEPLLLDRGEADGLGMLHALRADAASMIRDWDAALEAARASVRWRELHGHQAWLSAALDRLARMHLVRGELEAAQRAAERARRVATEADSASALALARAALARILSAEERYDEAARTAATAVAAARESADPTPLAEARLAQARARRGQERLRAARSAAQHALDLLRPVVAGAQRGPEALAILAADLLSTDPGGALELAERARREADRAGRLDDGILALEVLAAAHARAGDTRAAERCRHWAVSRLEEAAARLADPAAARLFLERPDRKRLIGPGGPERRRLEVLYEIVRELNGRRDPAEVIDTLLDRALEVLGAERGAIVLVSDDGEPHVVRARGVEEQTAADALQLSRTILTRAHGGEPVLALEPATDARFAEASSVRLFAIRAVVCVPLSSRGRRVGAIYVDSTEPTRRFGAADLEFLEALADHAALALENARALERLRSENERLRADLGRMDRLGPLIGSSPVMQELYRTIESTAPAAFPVLIRGESGTGKELVARALHRLGPHSDGPFVPVNCAAMPEAIFESLLFGHEKGAFTGADRARPGLILRADGGTLFLDEIAELPPALQAKLLRVLEEGQVVPLGATRAREVSFRLLAATHRDLADEVAAGRFRDDLLYRLDVLRVTVPPLRERLEDLPQLVAHLLDRLAESFGPLEASPGLIARLASWSWPGNVRELENVLARLGVRADGTRLDERALSGDPELSRQLGSGGKGAPTNLDSLERDAIRRALELTGGHRERAAAMLGIGRATLFRKIRSYALQDVGRPPPGPRRSD